MLQGISSPRYVAFASTWPPPLAGPSVGPYVHPAAGSTWRPALAGPLLRPNRVLNSVEDLIERVDGGADEGIVLQAFNKSSPHRVLDDVARDNEGGFLVS